VDLQRTKPCSYNWMSFTVMTECESQLSQNRLEFYVLKFAEEFFDNYLKVIMWLDRIVYLTNSVSCNSHKEG